MMIRSDHKYTTAFVGVVFFIGHGVNIKMM